MKKSCKNEEIILEVVEVVAKKVIRMKKLKTIELRINF